MSKRERPRGWWYPYIFVGAFAVVIAVNGALLYFATSTFSGLQTENAYEKGVAYNQALAAVKAQERLGWTTAFSASSGGPATAGTYPTDLLVTFHDRDGRPLDDLDVKALVTRPTVAGHDQKVGFIHLGAGRYGARVDLPMPGQWQLDLVAIWGDISYQVSERVVVE